MAKTESAVSGLLGMDMCENQPDGLGSHGKIAVTKMRVRHEGEEHVTFVCAYCASDIRDHEDYEVVAETDDFDESI